VAASRDGRRVVATLAKPITNLWSVPLLDRLADERDVKPYPVPTVRALAPRFKGTSVFYLSARGTGDGLWRLQDGQASEIWKEGWDGALGAPPAVSPDGRRVAIILRKDGKRRVTIMSADGSDALSLAESIDAKGAVDWAPDATFIAIGGSDAQGPGLFKVPVDGGAPVRLVKGGATNPVWSPDGTLIVYAGPNVGGKLPLLGVRPDGTAVELPRMDVSVRTPQGHRFLPSGKGLVYLQFPLDSATLDFQLLDLATMKIRQLARFASQGEIQTFDITADGTQIVFDRTSENSDIVLIDLPK
jgi:Tol biopolymer transport system component